MLHNARIPPPYILAGHSMGGYDVRLFAKFYRSEAAGMIFVDASHPEQVKRFPQALNDLDKTWVREQEFLTFSMPFGIPRLLGFCGNDAQIRAADCNFHSYREGLAELKRFPKAQLRPPPLALLAICLLLCFLMIPPRPNPRCPPTWSSR